MKIGNAAVAMAVLTACTTGRGPTVDEEPLSLGADTVHTPFAQVPVAAAMTVGRWLVVAPDWDQAVVADFARRATQPLGAGPGRDFQRPLDVFAAGDSLYVADWGMRRLTIWTREGALAGTVAAPEALGGLFPRGRDTLGRFYFELPVSGGPGGVRLRDSVPVIRSAPPFLRADTILQLAPPEVFEVTRDGRTRLERVIYGGRDRWGVLPDGEAWVARVNGNRVTWISPDGRRRSGRGLPDPVYEVTQYDRDSYAALFPPELRGAVETLPFALIKPPFERGFTGPDGLVWLEKSKAGPDSLRRVHVVGHQGELLRILVVPTKGQIIAVGDAALLVAEQWREGVRLLEARLPD